jgi:hypothetical protein
MIEEALIPERMDPYTPTIERARFERAPIPSRANRRITIVLGAIAYIAAFQWAYATILVGLYAYEGFQYHDVPAIISATWVLALLPSLWMPTRLVRPSQLAYWFLYLAVIVPVCVVTVHSYPGDPQAGVRTAAWIVCAFAVLGLIYLVRPAAIPHYRLPPQQLWVAILLLSTLSYGLIFSSFGVQFHLTTLSEIYSVRSEYKTGLDNGNIFVSYAVDWQALVLNPLLIIVGLITRRKLLTSLGIIGQLLIFSFTGFRTVLFSTTLVIGLLIICGSLPRFGIRMLAGWTVTVAAATALYLWSGSLFLSGLIVERLTGLPGLLTGFYFRYFTHHPKMMLSHSVLRGSFDNPYGAGPPTIIGSVYFPQWGAYANANLWADAFANFGIWGVFAFTLILGVVFWFYDSITLDLDLRLAALMLAMPSLSLANAGLLTCLLTHGLGFACVVMYYLPNRVPAPLWSGNPSFQYVHARSAR